jgi:hypothetical protein
MLKFSSFEQAWRAIEVISIPPSNGSIAKGVPQPAAATKAQIIQSYAALSLPKLMAANNQALIASVTAGCRF